jgi:hypothetical protein
LLEVVGAHTLGGIRRGVQQLVTRVLNRNSEYKAERIKKRECLKALACPPSAAYGAGFLKIKEECNSERIRV